MQKMWSTLLYSRVHVIVLLFIWGDLFGNICGTRSRLPQGWQRRLDTAIYAKLRTRSANSRTELRKRLHLFQGDIVIDEGFMDGSRTFTGELHPEQYWPKGIPIPYTISSSFDVSQEKMIRKAMDDLTHEVSGCIFFKERDDEEDYIHIVLPRISTMCNSIIGRRTGEQRMNLGEDCFVHGTIQHELMHALGFFHEQSRPDRDHYIIIFEENIIPGTIANFRIMPGMATYGVPYDISSVMHYGWNDLSIDAELPSILPRDENARARMGQRDGMTEYDAAKIMAAYQCSAPAPTAAPATAATTTETSDHTLPAIEIDELSVAECRSLDSQHCQVSSQSDDCRDSILHISCGMPATDDEIQNLFLRFQHLQKSRPLTVEIQGNRALSAELFAPVRDYVIELTIGYHNGISGDVLRYLDLPHLLGLGFFQCHRIRLSSDALYTFTNLRILEFGQSSIDLLDESALASLPNLQLLALDYDVQAPFRMPVSKNLWKLHCSCEYQWLRDLLIDKSYLIAEKRWGELHRYGNRGSITYTKRDIFVPVDCGQSTERSIVRNTEGIFASNVQC